MALDLGARRIGVAVSDPLGITAQGLETIERRNKRVDLAEIHRVAGEYQVTKAIVGLPLHMSGDSGFQAEKARAFASELERHLKLPVELCDERLTTAEALRVLNAGGATLARKRAAVDRMAATLLLQSYLDREPR